MFLVFYFDDMISSSFFNRLFVQPLYCGVLLEQSLMLNRRRDDKDRDGRLGSEKVTRICFCILRIQNEYPLSLLSYLVLIFFAAETVWIRIARDEYEKCGSWNTARSEVHQDRPHPDDLRVCNHVARDDERNDSDIDVIIQVHLKVSIVYAIVLPP